MGSKVSWVFDVDRAPCGASTAVTVRHVVSASVNREVVTYVDGDSYPLTWTRYGMELPDEVREAVKAKAEAGKVGLHVVKTKGA